MNQVQQFAKQIAETKNRNAGRRDEQRQTTRVKVDTRDQDNECICRGID